MALRMCRPPQQPWTARWLDVTTLPSGVETSDLFRWAAASHRVFAVPAVITVYAELCGVFNGGCIAYELLSRLIPTARVRNLINQPHWVLSVSTRVCAECVGERSGEIGIYRMGSAGDTALTAGAGKMMLFGVRDVITQDEKCLRSIWKVSWVG